MSHDDTTTLDLRQPIYAYSAVQLTNDAYVAVIVPNTPIFPAGSQSFSFGGWVRLLAEQEVDGRLFLASQIMPGTTVELSVLGATPMVSWPNVGEIVANEALQLNRWHYLIATYLAQGNQQGVVSFYLDGEPIGQQQITISSPSPAASTNYIIGGFAPVQLQSFSIWYTCLIQDDTVNEVAPQWQVPSPSPGLVLACDFSVCPARDRSGNNIPIGYSDAVEQGLYYPGLLLGDSNYALPDPADGTNPGGAGNDPFSILAWIYPTAITPSILDSGQVAVLATASFADSAGLIGYLEFDPAATTYKWSVQLGGIGGTVLTSAAFDPDAWHHVAVTSDGQTLTLYLDGQVAGSTPVVAPPALPVPMLMIGAAPDSSSSSGADYFFEGYIQAVSVWPTNLSAQDIVTYMTTEPDETSGCSAYYNFGSGRPVNVLTGAPVTLYGDATISELWAEYLPTGLMFAPHPPPANAVDPIAAMLDSSQFSLPESIDLSVRPTSNWMSDAHIDHILADYERLLSRFAKDDATRDRFRQMFTANLYRGVHLQNASPSGHMPGTVTFTRDGGELVFHTYTNKGPIEILRVDGAGVTDCQAWVVQVIATVVQVVLLAIGFGLTVLSIGRLTQTLLIRLVINHPEKFTTLRQIFTTVDDVNATNLIKGIRVLSGVVGLGSLVTNILANISWWSLAWTVATAAAQVASIWLTGGLYLLYVLAQAALFIGQLVSVVRAKPDGCNVPPRLLTLDPPRVQAGGSDFQLRVMGEGFLDGAVACWTGHSRTTAFVSSTEVDASITQADIATAGAYAVTVLNPSSNNQPSNTVNLRVTS